MSPARCSRSMVGWLSFVASGPAPTKECPWPTVDIPDFGAVGDGEVSAGVDAVCGRRARNSLGPDPVSFGVAQLTHPVGIPSGMDRSKRPRPRLISRTGSWSTIDD